MAEIGFVLRSEARRVPAECGACASWLPEKRTHVWKVNLQRLVDQIHIPITVCHYPPGTSKWNKIEHRLFSYISMNWRGEPLVSYETIVNLIGSTRTRSGLKVKAMLDTREYETGKEVPREKIDALALTRHTFHPDWNYTLEPHQAAQTRRRTRKRTRAHKATQEP